jgi:NAD(P)-dependent dehydrogenase (short-subunit alcohol dehydrogenase family)
MVGILPEVQVIRPADERIAAGLGGAGAEPPAAAFDPRPPGAEQPSTALDPWPLPPGPVLVTGGARGIGLAVATLAAAAGGRVAVVDRDREALDAAAVQLGGDALLVACDVRDEGQVRAAFDTALGELGSLQGVVASAGIDRGGPFHESTADDFDELIAVNLRGAALTCREAIRRMLPTGAGSIVCVSSPFAFVGGPAGTGAYSASKGGVSALVKALAVEYGPRGIRVNAVLPGPTETDLMWANVSPADVPATRATVAAEVPLRRLADPLEPARAALWLLSDQASYVTGAQLACDGGVLAKASVSI